MAENREQRTENREQRTENREQRTENREQRTENNSSRGFECQESEADKNSELYNRKGKQGNKQYTEHWKRCCYCNYENCQVIGDFFE